MSDTMNAAAARRRQHRRTVDASWARAARTVVALTQDELARRLDITSGTVSKRETGEYTVYVETWHAILSACGLPSAWKPGDPATPTPAKQ